MLIDDIRLGLAPFSRQEFPEGFEVMLSPSHDKLAQAIAKSLTDRASHQTLAEAVCDFVRECAHVLLIYGRADYEIDVMSDGASVVGYRLEPIPPGTLVFHESGCAQQIPRAVADEFGASESIEIDAESVVSISSPVRFSESRTTVFEALSWLSQNLLPSFALPQDPRIPSEVPFDMTEHRRARDAAIAAVTAPIGWNARGFFENDALEYYLTERFLRFQELKIDFRNSILDGLNAYARRVGRDFEWLGELVVKGLPTQATVDTARQILIDGRGCFKAVVNPFSLQA